jgi:hypothetical protein
MDFVRSPWKKISEPRRVELPRAAVEAFETTKKIERCCYMFREEVEANGRR